MTETGAEVTQMTGYCSFEIMTGFSIHSAKIADASAISAMIQITARETNSADYSADVIELICSNFSPEKVILKMQMRDVFVCYRENLCVGTVSIEGDKLHSLFVKPDFQRQGIGTRLVKHLEQFATGKSLTQLQLSSSITALPFYQHLGYLPIRFEERKDGSTHLMTKELL